MLSGSNINPSSEEYTHGVVIRFRSRQLCSCYVKYWLYGAFCWLLFTGMLCSWSFWDIFEQLRIQRSKETGLDYAYMGLFLKHCVTNTLLQRFLVQILKFWLSKVVPVKTDVTTQNYFENLRFKLWLALNLWNSKGFEFHKKEKNKMCV